MSRKLEESELAGTFTNNMLTTFHIRQQFKQDLALHIHYKTKL